MRLRNFCFTINNPKNDHTVLLEHLKLLKIKYAIFQLEQGTKGTKHYQGYCELDGQKTLKQIKFRIPTAHIERRRGSAKQASDYCEKTEGRVSGPWRCGDLSKQGGRTDINSYYASILSGANLKDLLEEHTMCVARYPKFIQSVRGVIGRERRLDLKIELHYGKTGIGKTRQAYDRFPSLYAVPIGEKLWFDGYDSQKVMLFDDFKGELKLTHLLRLLDIYPIQLPVKGAHIWLRANKIIITSNFGIEFWYDYTSRTEQLAALKRRIHKIVRYDGDGITVEKDAKSIEETTMNQTRTDTEDNRGTPPMAPEEEELNPKPDGTVKKTEEVFIKPHSGFKSGSGDNPKTAFKPPAMKRKFEAPLYEEKQLPIKKRKLIIDLTTTSSEDEEPCEYPYTLKKTSDTDEEQINWSSHDIDPESEDESSPDDLANDADYWNTDSEDEDKEDM